MRQVSPGIRASLAALIMLSGVASAQELLLVDITVNYRHRGSVFLYKDEHDNYFAAVSDLAAWGVRGPYIDRINYGGSEFVRLKSLGKISIDLDPQTASASINIPASLLPTQQLSITRSSVPETVSSTGVYLDYDWSYTAAESSFPSGLLAPTFFSEAGILHTQVLYQGYERKFGIATTDGYEDNNWIRLDTTFSRDFPDRMRSLRIGDVVASPGPWGGAQRVGGAQLASNFTTKPSFISFPIPSLQGAANLPSTLDLYVDGALRHRESLEAGPFRADEIPVVTGAGQLQMVVTDILGREQLYTQEFYAGGELLRTGLSEYSYTLGALRENFGFASNTYGESALLAEHRYGLSDTTTVGGRAEVSGPTRNLSATVDWSPRMAGVVNLGLGFSDSDSGSGSAWLLGYSYRNRDFSFAARASGTSDDFDTVGLATVGTVPKTQVVVNGGWNHPTAGAFGAAYVRMDYHDAEARDVFTLSYSKTLFERYFFSLYTNYIEDRESDFSLGLSVSTTFGRRHNATASVTQNADNAMLRTEVQSTPPIGPGIGYRIGSTVGDIDRFDARLIGQTDYGKYVVETNRFGDSSSSRVGASGSIAWLAGRPYFSREINDGFAVARIGNLQNVRVYVENQEIGRTDKKGRLLLPRLRPYETNRIRIEPTDLPLAAQAQTISMEVAPALRSGIVVDFPVSIASFALLRALLPDGAPVPGGATVHIEGNDTPTVVGLDGAIYATGVAGATTVSVELPTHLCRFEIELPPPVEIPVHLGDFECVAEHP
jgi:outer membrane usher protein